MKQGQVSAIILGGIFGGITAMFLERFLKRIFKCNKCSEEKSKYKKPHNGQQVSQINGCTCGQTNPHQQDIAPMYPGVLPPASNSHPNNM